MNIKKLIRLIAVILLAHSIPAAFAENIFELRLNPSLPIPAGVKNFRTGFGVETGLDWSFSTRWGLSLSGGYSQLGIDDGSAFALVAGELGPFMQWRLKDRLTLRAGLHAGIYHYSWQDAADTKFMAGLGIQPFFHISPSVSLFANIGFSHYLFSLSEPLNTIRVGLGISLNFSEILQPQSRIVGWKIAEQRLFPVSYAWYEHNPVATVRIRNDEPNAITDVSFSFYQEQYTNQASVFAVLPRIGSGIWVDVPVTALFNESMLDLTENINVNALVQVEYRSLGAQRQASFPVDLRVYHRNAFAWDDDRRAASFVSARDPAAVYFARYTEAAVRNTLRPDLPKNLQYAAALFEALHLYKMNYVIDPASSYVELSENASALDTLNYPYQTLFYRGGDCDDLSILYCSLLEVLGVETAFITIPGHIYAAFDAGDEEWAQKNRDNLIEQGGKFWIPVEITLPAEGFFLAWRIGAQEWRSAAPDNRALFPMADSWTAYPPVSVPGAGDQLPVMPDEYLITRRLAEILGN
jgi:hypothetical protein